MHRVMIQSADYTNCREAVDRAFDLFSINTSGKKVLVKPNVLRGSTPEEGVTTHPAVLKAVVERLEADNPASIVVGDNPGAASYGANEKTFKTAGLVEAAKGYYRNLNADPVEVAVPGGIVEKATISREILDADVIISLPKFKTHGLTTISGAIKNSYGFLPGAQKAALHFKAGNPVGFHQLIVDIFGLRVPDFFIVDGVLGMEGNGPVSTELRQVNRILAGDNGVAVDATIARMMGRDPAELRFLQIARERGHGDFEASAIEIIGEMTTVPDFKLPPKLVDGEPAPKGVADFLYARTLVRPKVDQDTCTACETCVEVCPAGALYMADDGYPAVREEVCVTCFCCQEMCPVRAIALS